MATAILKLHVVRPTWYGDIRVNQKFECFKALMLISQFGSFAYTGNSLRPSFILAICLTTLAAGESARLSAIPKNPFLCICEQNLGSLSKDSGNSNDDVRKQ